MTEAQIPLNGRRVDSRFTLLEKSGSGGQGEVWRAHDETRGVDIALKVPPANGVSNDTVLAAFEREYTIAARLDHPNILKIFQPHRSGDVVVLPMELATGGDLRRLRGAGYLDIIPVLLDIAQALEHAHDRGVIHRDLKPGNVLFDARGRVKLADFGAAGTTSTSAADARKQGLSPFTASPEQLRGEAPAEGDDIYGLGALAYELLSGYPPYYPHFDLRRAQEEPVPTLTPTRQIPPLLHALVTRMLAKNRRERPNSMREVIDELDAALNDTLAFEFETLEEDEAADSDGAQVAPNGARDGGSVLSGRGGAQARSNAGDDRSANAARRGQDATSASAPSRTHAATTAPSPREQAATSGSSSQRAQAATSAFLSSQRAQAAAAASTSTQSPPQPKWAAKDEEDEDLEEDERSDDEDRPDLGLIPELLVANALVARQAAPTGKGATGTPAGKGAATPASGARTSKGAAGVTAPPPGATARASGPATLQPSPAASVLPPTGPAPTSTARAEYAAQKAVANTPVDNETLQLPASMVEEIYGEAPPRPVIDDPIRNETIQLPPPSPTDVRSRIAASLARGQAAPQGNTSPATSSQPVNAAVGANSSAGKAQPAPLPGQAQPRQPLKTDIGINWPHGAAASQPSLGTSAGAAVNAGPPMFASAPPQGAASVQTGASALAAAPMYASAGLQGVAPLQAGTATQANTSPQANIDPGITTTRPPTAPPLQQAPMAAAPLAAGAAGGGGPNIISERPLWDSLQLDAVPRLRRLEPIRNRRWPLVLLGVLAVAAVAVFYWLPRYAPDGLPLDLSAWTHSSNGESASSSSASSTEAASAAGADTSDGSANAKLQASRENFDRRLGALEARGAGVWGGPEFGMAKTRAAESVGAFDAGNMHIAQERLADASHLLDEVESRAPQALAAEIAAGQKALAAGQQEIANQAFDLARRIDPNDKRIADGQRRVRNLNGVLPLLADAQNAESAGDFSRAAQDYSQVLRLDPGNDKARSGLARANAAFGDDNYAKAVGSGFAALGAGRIDDARADFEKARALRPNGSEAAEGLRRVGAEQSSKGFSSLRQRAAGLEAQERWDDAVQVYDQVLQSDPSLAFAQEGKDRAAARAELSASMQALIDKPERLAAQSVRSQARALIATANQQSPSGPVLRSQIAQLTLLLPENENSAWSGTSAADASSSHTDLLEKPVRLSLVSDDATAITIPSIGQFGTFSKRDVELKPGRYTVIGTREGYRDIHRDITIAPGQESQTISVSCSDPI